MMNYNTESLLHVGDVPQTDLFISLVYRVRHFLASLHGEGRTPVVAWIERGGRVRVAHDFPINTTSFKNATAMGVTSCASTSRPETVTRRLIAELENKNLDCVVFTSRYMGEFGVSEIGLDYAQIIGKWIGEHYEVQRVFPNPETRGWKLVMMRPK